MPEVGSVIDADGICSRLDRLVKDAGSQRAYCRAHSVSEGTLSDALCLRYGVPGSKILAAIGVSKEVITVYRIVRPEAECRLQKEPASA